MISYPTRRLLAALLLVAAAAPGLARAGDVDRDGLDDAAEDALLARHAPLVLLHPVEPYRPASVEWTLARAQVEVEGHRPRVLQASVAGAFVALVVPDLHVEGAHLRVARGARPGAGGPHGWEAYGHAFRAPDGGLLLQYWFYYPFNAAYWAFDHEGDWEHVTVRLDAAGWPVGAWYAAHGDAMPGPWIPWSALAREGDHPLVFAARGTHASYASPDEAPFWDPVCEETDPARAEAAGCAAWRTWDGPRGVVNMGERSAPRAAFVAWPGRWGSTGRFGREGAADAPEGPAFQPGWCSEGAPGACP